MPLRRNQAGLASAPLGEPECMSTEQAIAELENTDPSIRQRAARCLQGKREAADALCTRFAVEKNIPTREALAVSIMRTGGAEAVDRLLPLLSSDDAAQRNTVIEILQALPDAVAPRMEALLGHGDSDVRIFAVNVLEALRHPKVENWLIDVIARDRHVNVVATALDLLAEVGTEAAIPALKHVTARFADEPYVKFAAGNAIKRIGA